MGYQIMAVQIESFREYLVHEERSSGTIKKYMHDIEAFTGWLKGREVSRETAAGWKEYLIETGYAAVTVNSMLSAINGFFLFQGWEECRVKFLRIQRRMFREPARNLSREEYIRLLDASRSLGKKRLTLLMETICGTGIRISEVKYITVEAARRGRTDIMLKGKVRTILLPGRLCRKLLEFAKGQKVCSGEIFLTRDRKSLSRRQIWQEMKNLCAYADVEPSKVFPHNLRHLFAVTFYHIDKDIVRLADVLGHSSIETTRIYLISTGEEYARQLEELGLVS